MKIFGICMVRDAEDIIEYVVKHMMEEVDHVVVADNLSKDRTRNILESLTGNITVIDDNDPAYRQSEKMTALAMLAKKMGAEWVVPFDADEWWYATDGDTIANTIRKNNYCINAASMYDHVVTATDGDNPNPIKRIAWRKDTKTPLHKVACRVTDDLVIEMGNHNATYTTHMPTYSHNLLEVRHYPVRTAEQFMHKAIMGGQALELTDLPETMGLHWRHHYTLYQSGGKEIMEDAFQTYYFSKNPTDDGLIFDPVIP